MTWILRDDGNDNHSNRAFETRSEAEAAKEDMESLGVDVELTKQTASNGGSKVELDGTDVVEMSGGDGGNSTDTDDDDDSDNEDESEDTVDNVEDEHAERIEAETVEDVEADTKQALDKLGDSIEEDPLSVLPGYMITLVDGKPSLNKRGVSVLAYHYDIDVTEREVVAYPHDHEFETAVVEIMVEGGDGRTFSGVGEAHVDETPKHQLLRMAETRAYKRAVIFATGTGIVSYQEMVSHLEGGHE